MTTKKIQLNAPVKKQSVVDMAFKAAKMALYEKSFYAFFVDFWEEAGNTGAYQHEWAIEVICDHMQARYENKLGFATSKKLAIALPPSSGKTAILGVAYQAWIWGAKKDPGYSILYSSYSEDLSNIATSRFKNLIISEKYQYYYGEVFALGKKQDTKVINDKGGTRYATGTAGLGTGLRVDEVMGDDLLKSQEADSGLMQKQVGEWFVAASSRYKDIDTFRQTVIAQRLSENDSIGQALAKGFELLRLPMEYDHDDVSPPTPIGWVDPRTMEGELLFKRISKEKVAELKQSLGQAKFDAQYNQKPYNLAGNIIKREDIRLSSVEKFKKNIRIMSVDSAYKAKKTSDDSAFSLHYANEKFIMNYKGWAGKLEYNNLKTLLIDTINEEKPDLVIIEDRASGISLLTDLQELGLPTIIVGVQANMDKAFRAHRANVHIARGRFMLCDSPDNYIYTKKAIKDLARFPGGKNIDLADSIIQAINYVGDTFGFEALGADDLPDAPQNKEEQKQAYLKHKDKTSFKSTPMREVGMDAVQRLDNIYSKYI